MSEVKDVVKGLIVYNALKGFFGGLAESCWACGCLVMLFFPLILGVYLFFLALLGWVTVLESMVKRPSWGYGLLLVMAIASTTTMIVGIVRPSETMATVGLSCLYFGGLIIGIVALVRGEK
jgi:hypothetical protein